MLPFIELAQLSPIAPVPGQLQAGFEFGPVVVINPIALPFIELAQLSPIAPVPGRLQAGFELNDFKPVVVVSPVVSPS